MERPQIENTRFWTLTEASLRYIIRDASEAACNLPDCSETGRWLDQVNDACTVIGHRQKENK